MEHPHLQIYVKELANVKRNYMMKAVDKEWMPKKVKEIEGIIAGLRKGNREEE